MTREVWKTRITKNTPEETLIRGYPLEEVIEKLSFAEATYLLLKGELPSKEHAAVMNAILVSCVDHGLNPPSIQAGRRVISGGSPLQAGVAAGVLALGDSHGGAIEQCAKFIKEAVDNGKSVEEVVEEAVANKKRLPGFGHKIYKVDPRAQELLKVAKKNNLCGKYVEFAVALEVALEKAKGRKLCMNIDGITAALLLEMDFPWQVGKGFFIIGRTVGLVAHCTEESMEAKPFRRLSNEDVEYTGQDKRTI